MGYVLPINVRPALPLPADGWIDAPITDAEWDAMTPAERAFIKEGTDAIERGEIITDAEMQIFFDKLLADLAKR
jgi:hypothetical protein